jgi:ribosomal protein L12E/L44/L45/RPP1/RPP2
MADDDFDLDDDLDTGDSGPRSNSDFAALRKANQTAKRAEAERDAARREMAFIRAGIDPEDKRLSYFVKGYEGDLKADSIKQAAIEAGFIAAPEPDPAVAAAQSAAQEAQAAAQRIAGLSLGGEQAPSEVEADVAAMQEAFTQNGIEGLTAYMASKGIPQSTA